MTSSSRRKPLGELEMTVLSALWSSASPLSVREALGLVKRQPALAYTTVQTVLDRLYEKNLVLRDEQGKAFLYRPRISREEWLGEQAAHVLTEAKGPPNDTVLMAFLDTAERADPAVIEQLSALIAKRRQNKGSAT
jgi:predicted transcriptional regulator